MPAPRSPDVGPGADLRTDLPKYRVYEGGELADEPTDVRSFWRDDMVAFLLGCSFTFETALLGRGCASRTRSRGATPPCT